MKKLLLIVSAVIALNANVMESVCELYKNDISTDKCVKLNEQVEKLENMLPRLTKKQRCEVIKKSSFVFEVADAILEDKFKPVYLPISGIDKREIGLNYFSNMGMKSDVNTFLEFVNGFNDIYNECTKGE